MKKIISSIIPQHWRLLWIVLLLSYSQQAALAQTTPVLPQATSYFIDLNHTRASDVYEIRQDHLSIQYQDAYGQTEEMALKVYNWQRDLVGQFLLDKVYGLNHYNIRLNELIGEWQPDQVYHCEAENEQGKRYAFSLKPVPPEKKEINANIMVNPIQFSCEELAKHSAEFYGEINGGVPPYTVNWYVLNESRTDFLYQPRQESISEPGTTMMIQVDKHPDYHVLLRVEDACGNEAKQTVLVACDAKQKRINTLFIESLPTLPPTAKDR